MRIDWKIWHGDVKIHMKGQKFNDRDAFDLYCEDCSPKEAADLLSHHTILDKDVTTDAHV